MEQDLSQLAKQLGQRGGQKTAKRGKQYFSEIGAKGAEARWKDHKKNGKK